MAFIQHHGAHAVRQEPVNEGTSVLMQEGRDGGRFALEQLTFEALVAPRQLAVIGRRMVVLQQRQPFPGGLQRGGLTLFQQFLHPALAGLHFYPGLRFSRRGEQLIREHIDRRKPVGIQAHQGLKRFGRRSFGQEERGFGAPLLLDGGSGRKNHGGSRKATDEFQADDRLAGARRRDEVLSVIARPGSDLLQNHPLVFAEGMPELQRREGRTGGRRQVRLHGRCSPHQPSGQSRFWRAHTIRRS